MLAHRKALVYIGILNLCYMVCLGVSAPYALLMPYLANRFTYFLRWLMLSLFPGPEPFVLPFGSVLLTFTNSHEDSVNYHHRCPLFQES